MNKIFSKLNLNSKKSSNLILAIFCFMFLALLIDISSNEATSLSVNNINKDATLDKEFSGIAKVTDGDSIKVEEKKIRLIGIDAPEYSQTCFNKEYEEYRCGKMAKEFLITLADGKNVKCFYKNFDKYNRYLSKCYVGEIMINQEILKNGMGVIYSFGKKDEEMQALEDYAKEKKLGIWQGAFQLPKDYRKSKKK